ncbi:hypothetical protein HM1_1796 [Heliomicrobium modesticaldum Ice1]|uniref:Uncharacterized protein n=1 Tax=Heliobacterium modesticaldum (strain ATCC 51547 / Ice1) TaxID=498761 RepID=B0TEW0_HELMI|nr:hypothetical protein HM1_1796 [Heliomicrobium modesticaldum Ice1]
MSDLSGAASASAACEAVRAPWFTGRKAQRFGAQRSKQASSRGALAKVANPPP